MEDWYCKKPCNNCPFRIDVKPYLRTERGIDLAYLAENPHNDFTCHKTMVDDSDGEERLYTEKSKTCAGFLSLVINENGDNHRPEGFKVSKKAFDSVGDMIDHFENSYY